MEEACARVETETRYSRVKVFVWVLDCTGPSYCLGVRSTETQFLSGEASSEVTRGDSLCVTSKEILRWILNANYDWGDKLGIMGMEPSEFMAIGRNHTGLARGHVHSPTQGMALPGISNTTRGKNCAWDYPGLNVILFSLLARGMSVSLASCWCRVPSMYGLTTRRGTTRWKTWPDSSQCRDTSSSIQRCCFSARNGRRTLMAMRRQLHTALKIH